METLVSRCSSNMGRAQYKQITYNTLGKYISDTMRPMNADKKNCRNKKQKKSQEADLFLVLHKYQKRCKVMMKKSNL